MTLYLPPEAAEDQRRRFDAEVLKRVTIEDQRALEFTAKLQAIDPSLFMVKAHEPIAPGTPLVPGFYHILRRNQGAPMSIFTIHDDGRYVEPDSRVFDRLAAGDLRERRVMREILGRHEIVEKAVAKEQARDNEDRRDELKERTDAVTRTQITTDRSRPWSQNVAGRRGARP